MDLIAGIDVPLLAATASIPPPGSSLTAFIAALTGQTVDSCGGFPAGQCTALACLWCHNLGLETPCGYCGTPDHCDGACWQGGGYPGWTWIVNTPSNVPSPGDVVCYRADCAADSIGAAGHVGIFVSGNLTSFTGFDQNWGTPTCRLIHHGYECVVGWHHPDSLGNPCAGVVCPPCETCSGGVCVDACAPGDTCVAGVCTPPVIPPPPSSTGLTLAAAGLLFGGAILLATWEAQRRPGAVRALEGGGTASLGRRGDHHGVAAVPRRSGAPSTRIPSPRRRGGLPSGEPGLGAGLRTP